MTVCHCIGSVILGITVVVHITNKSLNVRCCVWGIGVFSIMLVLII